MSIEIKTVISYNYKCSTCNYVYNEQRNSGQDAFYTKCHSLNCTGNYELINQTEYTYEEEVADPIEETPNE
jgi:hypothetical protein